MGGGKRRWIRLMRSHRKSSGDWKNTLFSAVPTFWPGSGQWHFISLTSYCVHAKAAVTVSQIPDLNSRVAFLTAGPGHVRSSCRQSWFLLRLLSFLSSSSCPQCGFLYTSDIAVRLTAMTKCHYITSLKTLSPATIVF